MEEYLHLFNLPSVAEFMAIAFKVQAKVGRQCSEKLYDRAGYIFCKFKKHLDRYPKKKQLPAVKSNISLYILFAEVATPTLAYQQKGIFVGTQVASMQNLGFKPL